MALPGRGADGEFADDYASGGAGVWISRKAQGILVSAPTTDDTVGDHWLGDTLRKNGILGHRDRCYRLAREWRRWAADLISRETTRHNLGREADMDELQRCAGGTVGLGDVTILVTTFLRDGYLLDCLAGIGTNLPDCKAVVMDDGYPSAQKDGLVTYLPFDSGLPAKRNAGAKLVTTKYILMGSDDFDFGTKQAREGIEKLAAVLDANPEVDVASGRVHNRPYEGFMEIVPGVAIRETRLRPDGTKLFYKVDLTVNYFLARTAVLLGTPWDERMKIGGEHGDWFLDLKEKGKTVVWVPDVSIDEFRHDAKKVHPEYAKYRSRAKDLGHRILLQKRGVRDYWGF